MATSLPSKRIPVVDVPEVSSLKSSFQYNFFTSDERVNENGSAPESVLKKASETFDAGTLESVDFNSRVPRYNWLTWTPVNVGNRPDLIRSIKIRENLASIKYEDEFGTDDYTNLSFQDTGVNGKLMLYVRKLIEQTKTSNQTASPQQFAKIVSSATSNKVSSALLANTLQKPSIAGQRFFDKEGIENETNLLNELAGIKIHAQLNNKVLANLLNTVTEDAVSPYSDEIQPVINRVKEIQENAIATRSSTVFTGDDYDFEINDYVTIKKIDVDSYDSVLQTIGYVIEKTEHLADGTSVQQEPLILESPAVVETYDPRIKYGSTYTYSIRSVAYVEVLTKDDSGNNIFAVGFLVSSKKSPASVVVCEEYVAPPVPSDFTQAWDYKEKCLRLSWSFPPNSQRDIKKFQVFRRSSINEAFELIQMFDFDDSLVRSPYNETPDPSLVQVMSSPQLYFYDREFTKDSKFIYSICCVDAHGFSSNYSMQMEITFDKFGNRVKKNLISVSGAPKAYPNAYLNRDTFVDSIKDEGHSKMKIVFNPEYLKITNGKGQDLNLLRTNPSDSYQLQLINIDLQKQEIINIQLSDRTTESSVLKRVDTTNDVQGNQPIQKNL